MGMAFIYSYGGISNMNEFKYILDCGWDSANRAEEEVIEYYRYVEEVKSRMQYLPPPLSSMNGWNKLQALIEDDCQADKDLWIPQALKNRVEHYIDSLSFLITDKNIILNKLAFDEGFNPYQWWLGIERENQPFDRYLSIERKIEEGWITYYVKDLANLITSGEGEFQLERKIEPLII